VCVCVCVCVYIQALRYQYCNFCDDAMYTEIAMPDLPIVYPCSLATVMTARGDSSTDNKP
jgi:hypothetical protein